MDPASLFDHFCQATTFRNIQQLFYQICLSMDIDPTDAGSLYEKISQIDRGRANTKANNLWQLLDKRRQMSEYVRQTACNRLNVLVIGAGPCGLRAAVECALLGSNVVVVEQRDKFSRNNVLHLWGFVIQDLKALGAKIFYPKFCTGSIEHISIRQLQCILLKVALVLGVQVFENVGFSHLIEPEPDARGEVPGWRAAFEPHGHVLSEYEFDALIGADGKRNTLPGFPRQVVRGKLAIGITANFINNKTSAEEKVQEISGVAYIFNQAFFKDMKRETGVDLENIVYYKDETHYFVMCAKKQSLLEKGVIKQDYDDISLLLSRENVDQEMLCKYAAQAADFATHGKLPQLNYAQNHHGQADIAMFDFTALCSAVYSTRLSERCGRNLIMTIVGDSLHEPFWPTGSGAARGFLGCFDVAWMLRNFGLNKNGPTEIIAERENIYKLLAQTTKENMSKTISKYTIDPKTRYPSIEMTVGPHDVLEQVDTDNPRMRPTSKPLGLRCFNSVHEMKTPFKRKYRLWRFCHQALLPFKLKVVNFNAKSWGDGKALAALIGKFRSDLVNYISCCTMEDPETMMDTVFSAVESAYNISRPCEDHLSWANLRDSDRIDYLARIIENLKSDTSALQQILSPTIKAGMNRKRTVQIVDTSKAKKTEQIKRRAGDLINSFASTSVWPQNVAPEMVRTNGGVVVNGGGEGLDVNKMTDEEVTEFVEEMENASTPEDKRKIIQRHSRRLQDLVIRDDDDYKTKTGGFTQQIQLEKSTYSQKPVVGKLNPMLVLGVNSIVSGDYEKNKFKQMYEEKNRSFQNWNRKMDKDDLVAMEDKLEKTGMGLLFDKEKYKTLSSKEEKLMQVKSPDARQKAIEHINKAMNGHVPEQDKYKEIDEKLKKVDDSMKHRHLAGVNTVSKIKEMQKQNSISIHGVLVRKPPPPPPLKRPGRVSSDEDQENDKNEKNDVVFRPSQPDTIVRRPLSVPTTDIYSSVNGRRRQFCALCHSEAYLAEQMIIEKMTIHRKCFKCSYCEQPLRLGNSALDRDLMDRFGPRWFCAQHNSVPLHEKISRIEKLDKKNGVRATSVAVVAPTQKMVPKVDTSLKSDKSGINESTTTFYSTRSTLMRQLTVEKYDDRVPEKPEVEKPSPVSTNSPSALLHRTMERLRDRQARLAAMGTPPPSTVTIQGDQPSERVEFEPIKTVPGKRRVSVSKETHHFVVNDRSEDSSHEEEDDDLTEDEDSERSADELNDGLLEGSVSEPENELQNSRTSQGSNGKKKGESTEEESFDDDEIWSEFNEALETTLTQNLDQKITEQQAQELISNFNRQRSFRTPNVYVTPPKSQDSTTRNPDRTDASEYFTPMTSSRDSGRVVDEFEDFLTPKARPSALKRSSTETKVDVDASAIRERQMQRYNEMKELHRQQAKLKSDQELEQKHPSNRSSVPVESILYRLHNAQSNDESQNRPRLDDAESSKLSILDNMPSIQKSGRRRSRTRSRSPPPPVSLPSKKKTTEKRAGSDEPSFYLADIDSIENSPTKEESKPRAASETTGIFSRVVNSDSDDLFTFKPPEALSSESSSGRWFESSPSPNQSRNSESQKEANMLERMKRLRIRNAERRATVAVNLDRERQKELEKQKRNDQIQDTIDRLRKQRMAIKEKYGGEAAENGVKFRSMDVKFRNGLEPTDPEIVISPQNIKRVQKQAQKIIQRREQERQRSAQDIQRGLDETENRISEVFVVGSELEVALEKDPKNSWLLENWLLYVQELLQLQLREEDLNMRVKEISVAEKYRQLKYDLADMQAKNNGEIGLDSEVEKHLMLKTIEVLNEHNRIKAEMDASSKTHRKTVFEIQKILDDRQRSYQNFEPVFSKDRSTAFQATQRILTA